MKTYKANIHCSVAPSDKGTTCRVKYMVHFDTNMDVPLEDLTNDPELMDKVVKSCGHALHEKFFNLERVDLLESLKGQLNETGLEMLDIFVQENTVKFEQELIHP